jgi:predicted AlkP superfamily phosphohydrolase/phosphomutase
MDPATFMLYATPVILLISQEIRAYLGKKDLKKLTDEQTEHLKQLTEDQTTKINTAGEDRAAVLETTTLDVASKLAVHTSDKANALADELTEIHELVNGNTSALQAKINTLEAQLADARAHAAACQACAVRLVTPDKNRP